MTGKVRQWEDVGGAELLLVSGERVCFVLFCLGLVIIVEPERKVD